MRGLTRPCTKAIPSGSTAARRRSRMATSCRTDGRFSLDRREVAHNLAAPLSSIRPSRLISMAWHAPADRQRHHCRQCRGYSARNGASNHVVLSLVNTPLVGVGAQAACACLPLDAPAGGVTVSLTSSNPGVATVSPSSVTIAAGDNQAVVTVSGLSVGTTTLTAAAQATRRHAGHLRHEQRPLRAVVVDRAIGGHNEPSRDHLERRARWWAGGVVGEQ